MYHSAWMSWLKQNWRNKLLFICLFRKLYWCDWGTNGRNSRIMYSWMDGSHVNTLQSGSSIVQPPQAMTIDDQTNTLYYTTAQYVVGVFNMTRRRTLLRNVNAAGVAVFKVGYFPSVHNSMWPIDAIWWHKSGSTLAQVMAWCHHYLNQCSPIMNKVQLHLPENDFARYTSAVHQQKQFRNCLFRVWLKSPRGQWVNALRP